MKVVHKRQIQTICLIGVAALLPFILLWQKDSREALYEFLFYMPCLLFTIVGFLGEKLNQRRILCTAMVFTLTYVFWIRSLFQSGTTASAFETLLVLFTLPWVIFLQFAIPVRVYRSLLGLPTFALTFMPTVLLYYASSTSPFIFRQIPYYFHLPLTSYLAMGLILLLPWLKSTHRQVSFHIFTVLALLPILYVASQLLKPQTLENASLWIVASFISCAILLAYANFYLYWQKAYLDELTEIPNRRALNEKLEVLAHPYTIAMIDIDHFKHFNDTYGHEQGDTVLKFVAHHLRKSCSGEAFRYGGEEFCLVYTGSDAENCKDEIEKIRYSLSEKLFVIRSSNLARKTTSTKDRARKKTTRSTVHVTISIGVASSHSPKDHAEDTVTLADSALYRAKSLGRNRTILSREEHRKKAKA